MAYLQSQMLYKNENYYKWTAADDKDNPYYKWGTDHSELNRTEGYEVLYFINHLAKKWWGNTNVNQIIYQKIEKMIRHNVPSNIRTHKKIEDWIHSNWSSY